MIAVTVKTMDSQSRRFEVPDDSTVKDFKEKIASDVNVSAANQRLIFQGRVLADDARLTQEHNGKVLHLVQRLPVVTTAASATSSSSTNANAPFSETAAAAAAGGFNPSGLSQMIFQQAMNGLGNILSGGSISGNLVPNPTNPNEQIMNIQIDLNGDGTGPRPAAPTTRTSTTSSFGARTRPSGPPPSHRHMTVSAPRQQLQAVDRNLQRLESVLNRLEAQSSSEEEPTSGGPGNSSRVDDVVGAGDVFASEINETGNQQEAMDVESADTTSNVVRPGSTEETVRPETSTSTSPPSGGQAPTCATHPSLSELGGYYTRMLQAQRRLEPFVNQMVNILNTDPSFTSTQSPEYRRAARLLTQTLQGQQIMAEIQRLLSMVVIPLGRTPPRTMLLRAPPGVPHSHGGARRIHHAIHAGAMPFMAPRAPVFAPNRGRATGIQRPPGVPPGPIGAPIFRQRVIPMAAGGMQMGWRPPPNSATSNAPPRRGNVMEAAAAAAAAANLSSQTSFSNASSRASNSTVFNVRPPTYHVQVNASIQPQISLSVGESPPNSNNATPSGSTTYNVPNVPPQAGPQVQTSQSSMTTSTSAQTNRPTDVFPNIPGLDQNALSSLFQSVARSVQQAGGQSGRPGGAGIIVVQGPPGGEGQVQEDVSNVVGQSVYNAVFGQLAGSTQPSQGTGTPNVRIVTTNVNANRTPTRPVNTQASTTTTTASTPRQTSEPTHSSSSSDSAGSADFQDASDSPQQSQTNQPKPSTQQSTSAPSTDPRQSFMELLGRVRATANLLRFDLSQRMSQFMQNFGLTIAQTTQRPRRYLSNVFNSVTNQFTCNDILDALQGNTDQLRRLRTTIRGVTTEQYFPSNNAPSTDQLVQISGDVSEDVREIATEFFADARSVPDVDIVESNLSLMRHAIQRLLEIMFFSGEGSYDAEVARHIRYCLSMWIRMNESLLRGGRGELIQRLRNFRGLREGGGMRLLSALGPLIRLQSNADSIVFFFNLLSSLQSVSQNQIDQFVLSQAPSAVESEHLPFAEAQEQIPTLRRPSSSSDQSETPRSPRNSVPRSSARPTSPPPSCSSSNGSPGDSWKEEVPAEWVDTIVADGEAQENMEAQKPFSEAYIAGMPASKRRKVVS